MDREMQVHPQRADKWLFSLNICNLHPNLIQCSYSGGHAVSSAEFIQAGGLLGVRDILIPL